MNRRTTHITSPGGVDILEGLLLAVGRADVTAFGDLYDALAPRVYGLAARVIGDPSQAEDVAREVFLEVWRTAARFDPALGSALAWTMTLTHRRAVAELRSVNLDARYDAATPRPTRSASLCTALSPGQRESLELAYFGGHTHVEVSRLTTSPISTSATRLREVLDRLRDAMMKPAVEPA